MIKGELGVYAARWMVVRDGVDPSTSGFSDRNSHLLHTLLTWENATPEALEANRVGPVLVNSREDSSLSGDAISPLDLP